MSLNIPSINFHEYPSIKNRIVPANVEQVDAQSDRHDDMTWDKPRRVRLAWDDEKITFSLRTFPKATGIRHCV